MQQPTDAVFREAKSEVMNQRADVHNGAQSKRAFNGGSNRIYGMARDFTNVRLQAWLARNPSLR
jgi:hypothetical protein